MHVKANMRTSDSPMMGLGGSGVSGFCQRTASRSRLAAETKVAWWPFRRETPPRKLGCAASRGRLAVSLSRQQSSDPAFSQVDLLTIIGILALLVLWLTPALARTRVTDQSLQCRNNLRQLMHGWRMYAEDNNGVLVPPQFGGLDCFFWVAGDLNYAANNPDNTNQVYLANGVLGPYMKNPALYKCPADQSLAAEGGVLLPRVRTMSMNEAFSNYGEGWIANNYWHYQKLADILRPAPANVWVLIDEHPDSINDAACGVNMTPYGGIWQDMPGILHDGGCSFAFADGHCELHKWQDPRTLALNVTYTTLLDHGIIQANNVDVRWVQDHTTTLK